MGRNGEVVIIRLRITPSANRNTYSVATLIIHIPRVEALYASTLGYEIATPTELPGVRTIQQQAPSQHRGPIPTFPKGKEQYPNILKLSGNELPPLGEGWGGAFGLPPASSGNSDGVAISQPRVAGEARYPG